MVAGLIAAVTLTLVAGILISSMFAIEAFQERDRAKANALTAERKAMEAYEQKNHAEAVTEFLLELFRSTDPHEDGRVIRTTDLLDQAAVKLDANFADAPQIKADLLATLGDTYAGLRLYAKAANMYEKELGLRQATLGRDDSKALYAMRNLAWAYKGAGRPDEAIALAEETLKVRTAKLGAGHPETLKTALILGDAYRIAARPTAAIRLLEPTFELCKTKLGPSDESTLETMNNLALAYQVAGRLPQVIPLLKQTRDLMMANLGPDNHNTLNTTDNLANAYLAAGLPGQVLPLLEESLPRCRTKFGVVHPTTVASTYDLAVAYEATDQPAKARPLLVELAAAMRDQCGLESLELAEALARLGQNHMLERKYTEAEPVLRESLAIREKKTPGDWKTFNSRSLLGIALLGQHKFADAEPLLVQGVAGLRDRAGKIPASEKRRLRNAMEQLAWLYDAIGKRDEAMKLRKELQARRDVPEPAVRGADAPPSALDGNKPGCWPQ